MSQSNSGSAVGTRPQMIAAQPFIIRTSDATIKAWLNSLCDAVPYVDSFPATVGSEVDHCVLNDIRQTAPTKALWAAHVLDTDPLDSGSSAYIVSAEVRKRIQAGRY